VIPADWTSHRRDDGELLGWIRPEGEGWVAVDLFGHKVSAPLDWLDAEAVLELLDQAAERRLRQVHGPGRF